MLGDVLVDRSRCTKTNETKVLCGKTCVKYTSENDWTYFVYEEGGIILEGYKEGKQIKISDFDTTITEFPFEAPDKSM